MAPPTAGSNRVSIADYLAAEATSEIPHEFHDGDILAMSGGTYNRAAVATNTTKNHSTRSVGCLKCDSGKR